MKHSIYALITVFIILISNSCKEKFNVDFNITSDYPKIGDTVGFQNSSSGGTDYNWNFGDGETSGYRSPTHVFKSTGTYTVTLIVDGDLDLLQSKQITIYDSIPSIQRSVETIYYFENVKFKALAFNPYKHAVTYQWLFSANAQGETLRDTIVNNTEMKVSYEAQPTVFFKIKNIEERVSLDISIGESVYTREQISDNVFYINETSGRGLFIARGNEQLLRQKIFENGEDEPAVFRNISSGAHPFNLIVNEDEAKTVRLAFFMYLYGYTCQQIAETFTSLRRRTKKNNISWSPGSILQILQNERHCGDVLARKTWTPNFLDHKSIKNRQDRNQYRKREHHEPIISRDDFIAVQRLISNAKYGNKGILPELSVITEGALTGFVSVNPRWAAFSADDYRAASDSVNREPITQLQPLEVEAQYGDFDLRGYEIARSQFFDTVQKTCVTFSTDILWFSTECTRKFDNTLYVEILVHPKEKLFVEGINIVKKHSKPNQSNPKGGIVDKESAISASNEVLLAR